MAEEIDLRTKLSFRNAIMFPIQNKSGIHDILIGGILLCVPFFGWILNMGHRIAYVRKMQNGKTPFPSWSNWRQLFYDGGITFIGMLFYLLPGSIFLTLGYLYSFWFFYLIGGVLFAFGVVVIPGYMTHYCWNKSVGEIFRPGLVVKRVFRMGPHYWKAWSIVIPTMLLSFLGLLIFGIGFLFTSVWFWQTAGYSFANAFTNFYLRKGSGE